ncbi:MAG: PilN domain-containing protein [Acidobacteria bacterium]|jgi:Tfp pilus assembly protein PilN|nr:PilN domain-containing protein [Acidobacteriota bacterium]
MIRVNLLERKQKEPSKLPSLNLGGSTGLIAAALVLASLGWIGWRYADNKSQIGELKTRIADADKQIENLKKVLKQVDEFQAKKKALETKVEVISGLKRQQRVPVHLLDQISRQIPDYLWLEVMEEKESGVSLKGRATNYNAVSNFYNNLKDSPFFSEVTLGNTQRAPQGVSFALSCRFTPPPEEGVQPTAGPAAETASPSPDAAPRS